MREYYTEAIVLKREPSKETDNTVSLLTKELGKVTARAKSSRRITSKLAAHLEPGNLALVRLVEKNGIQVVDALKQSKVAIPLADLYALHALLAEGEADDELYATLRDAPFSWLQTLMLLGWDPRGARCVECNATEHLLFYIPRQLFVCGACKGRFGIAPDEVVLIEKNNG